MGVGVTVGPFWFLRSLWVIMGPFLVWGSLMTYFEFVGHFWSILGPGVTSGTFWVHLGLEVTFDHFLGRGHIG